jgi:hypothetical protein
MVSGYFIFQSSVNLCAENIALLASRLTRTVGGTTELVQNNSLYSADLGCLNRAWHYLIRRNSSYQTRQGLKGDAGSAAQGAWRSSSAATLACDFL